VGEDEVRAAVQQALAKLRAENAAAAADGNNAKATKLDVGSVRKALLGEGGALAGRPVEVSLLVRIAKDALGAGAQ
jgi:hypothetical protein